MFCSNSIYVIFVLIDGAGNQTNINIDKNIAEY